MKTPHSRLLGSQRFLPLFITQFMGAFNDNVFKNALVIIITYNIVSHHGLRSELWVTLAAGIFILPFFLFSATAGQIADRFEKSMLICWIKGWEVILACLATWSFILQDIDFMLVILFLFGTQSAFFGPLKYSILPDHLHQNELIKGNGLIEMATFLAILLGTITGGLLIRNESGTLIVSTIIIGFAIMGWLASLKIPRAPIAAPNLKLNFNLLAETWIILRHTAKHRDVHAAVIGISWFWLLGATFLSQFPNYVKQIIGGNEEIVTLFLTAFSIGIGIGSLLCNRILKGKISAKFVPLGALGMTLFTLDLLYTSYSLPPTTLDSYIGYAEFISHAEHWRIFADFMLIAISGGTYIVPLYSIIQTRCEAEYRSRTIAGLNIMNAFFMVTGSLIAAAVLASGFTVLHVFLMIAITNIAFGYYIRKRLSD